MSVNINIHAHLWRMKKSQIQVRMKKTLAGMDAIVLLSLPIASEKFFWGNDAILEFYKYFGDKIIPFAYVDPRKQDSARLVENLVNEGFRGVKLYPPVGFYPDNRKFLPFFKKVEELGIPILCHTGVVMRDPDLQSKFAQPVYLEGVLRNCPKLKIIAAHYGHPWFLETLAIASLNPNLYIDITAFHSFLSTSEQIELIKKTINKIGSERIVYGTDEPFKGRDHFIQERVKMLVGGIDQKDVDMIFGRSAAKLLNIPLPLSEERK